MKHKYVYSLNDTSPEFAFWEPAYGTEHTYLTDLDNQTQHSHPIVQLDDDMRVLLPSPEFFISDDAEYVSRGDTAIATQMSNTLQSICRARLLGLHKSGPVIVDTWRQFRHVVRDTAMMFKVLRMYLAMVKYAIARKLREDDPLWGKWQAVLPIVLKMESNFRVGGGQLVFYGKSALEGVRIFQQAGGQVGPTAPPGPVGPKGPPGAPGTQWPDSVDRFKPFFTQKRSLRIGGMVAPEVAGASYPEGFLEKSYDAMVQAERAARLFMASVDEMYVDTDATETWSEQLPWVVSSSVVTMINDIKSQLEARHGYIE